MIARAAIVFVMLLEGGSIDVDCLTELDQLVFGGWDLFPANAYDAAIEADVLRREHLDPIRDELEAIQPMQSVFFPEFVKRLRGEHVKAQTNKWELAEAVREDIRQFKATNGLERVVAEPVHLVVLLDRRGEFPADVDEHVIMPTVLIPVEQQ